MDASTLNPTAPAVLADSTPPSVLVEQEQGGTTPAPVRVIDGEQLRTLGNNLRTLFDQYKSDRVLQEQKWLRNLRQYLGLYDPEVEKMISVERSRAYPRITRVKIISTLARIMNLMFPGNERNWDIKASPSPDMSPQDVMQAIQQAMATAQGGPPDVNAAVQQLAEERAETLKTLLDDQLQEIGGDQTIDYVAINRKVLFSGLLYGAGVVVGPFAKAVNKVTWEMQPTVSQDPQTGAPVQQMMPAPRVVTQYKPMLETMAVWDFYPDMSAKTLASGDGWFRRIVMSKSQLRALANRPDFFGDQIKTYLRGSGSQGNYKPQTFESELRVMGTQSNVNTQKTETAKYEIIVWNGPISGNFLQAAGVEVPEGSETDDIEAVVWMVEGNVIKAEMNPWRAMGVDMKTYHYFQYDEDDTSPFGNGLPNVVRDSQMAISAATRMMMDNASVVCGPQLEINEDLLVAHQDKTMVAAYKVWVREGTGPEAQWPAVRNVSIDSHLKELMEIIKLFMEFADTETFVNPVNGGDMSKAPSEPFRTAAGASILKGDAALPFKDIVRNFDFFTQSVINALVIFNRKFNPTLAPAGDYNVIARGASSMVAKEIRGIQLDTLATTLRPEEMLHIDERKLVEERFKVRDVQDILVSKDVAAQRQKAQSDEQDRQKAQQNQMVEAQVRELLSGAFKNITQGQKNTAASDAAQAQVALKIMEQGANANDESGSEGKTGKPAGKPAAKAG